MTSVAVLGLGRMGTAVAERLRPHHDVRTWTRSAGGSPHGAVSGADVVVLCLYDARACHDVLTAALPSMPTAGVVVNTTTVGPDEAADLEAAVVAAGPAYLHSPVMGSTPAVAAGALTILAGGKPGPEAEAVLAHLGQTLVLRGSAEAASLKLLNNGVLGDSLLTLRRALARGDEMGLPREAVLDVLARGALGRFVDGRRDVLGNDRARPPATFAIGALAKDLDLLVAAIDTQPDSATFVRTLLAQGALAADDDVSLVGVATAEASSLASARLDISPEVVADPDVLRPLHAYALAHATGDPGHLDDAFLPTAHIEGYRDGAFLTWDLDAFRGVFGGSPADDEPTRSRRVERLDVRGSVATAVMTLHHGDVDFTDVFVLVRRPDEAWRIADKAYERSRTGSSAVRGWA